MGSLGLTVPGFGDRPALAVLPFENASRDPGEDYFADGVAEDLILRLSRRRSFPVISSSSSFFYRGGSVDKRQVREELGVGYVVRGSVRRGDGRVHLRARLFDVVAGEPVWEESHEQELGGILEVQEAVSQAIPRVIDPSPAPSGTGPAGAARPPKLESWDRSLRGLWHLGRLTREDNGIGRSVLEEAAELDPGYVLPLWGVVLTHFRDLRYEWSSRPEESVSETIRVSEIAARLDARDPFAHLAMAMAQVLSGKQEEVLASLEITIQLDPSLALAHYLLGLVLALTGEPDEGLAILEVSLRLSPLDQEAALTLATLALGHFAAGRYEEAAEWAKRSIERRFDWSPAYRVLASSYAQLGRMEEAREAIRRGRRLQPQFSESTTRMISAAVTTDLLDRFFDGLRRAGWRG